jgi:hypothetical protein
MWKFMMAKCQQMDLYMKERPGFPPDNLPAYPHNYDPRGRNKFEEDALAMQRFWKKLADPARLWFDGQVESGPGDHQYVLSSPKEAIVYLSSPTAQQGVGYSAQLLRVAGLALQDGDYTLDIIDPETGSNMKESVENKISGGRFSLPLPAFVDDLAVHIH